LTGGRGTGLSSANRVIAGLKVAFSVLACTLIIGFVDWRQIAGLIGDASPLWLAGVLALAFADRGIMAFKWILLIRGSVRRIPAADLVSSYYVGAFWGKFLPTTVGGDLVRVAWLGGKFGSGATVLSSVLIERLLGAMALAAFAVVGLGLLTAYARLNEPILALLTLALLVASTVIALVTFHRALHGRIVTALERLSPFDGVRRRLTKLSLALQRFRDRPQALRLFFLLSLFEQLFPILGTYLAARAFGVELSLVWVLMGMPIILAVSRVPISVQNLGIQEGIYAFVFALAGVPASSSILLSVTQRAAGVLSTLPGALFMLPGGWRGVRRLALEATTARVDSD
jgi:uncharacterized protein (TIRG00374 family)